MLFSAFTSKMMPLNKKSLRSFRHQQLCEHQGYPRHAHNPTGF
jgi:hypothetical protein